MLRRFSGKFDMFHFGSMLRRRAAACCVAVAAAALLLGARDGKAQGPAAAAPPAPAASAPARAAWLMSSDGGMPWQIAAMFTGFWVLAAVEIAVISKSANRLDKPKKKDQYQEEA